MYQISRSKVLYNGKAIKADPESFEELLYEFAKDKSCVYYKGVVQAGIRPLSFRVLDEHYARDVENVYFYSERKVKKLSAESAGFQALGFGFGRDENTAFWRDKTMRAEAQSLFPVADGLAIDSQAVYWKNKRILKKSLSPSGIRAYICGPYVYFWNGDEVWFSQYGWDAKRVEAVAVDFRPYQESYAGDASWLFYEGKPVARLEGLQPTPLTSDWELVSLGDTVMYRGRILTGGVLKSLVLVDGYPLDNKGVFRADGERLCYFGVPAQLESQEVENTLRQVVHRQWQMQTHCFALSSHYPVEGIEPESIKGLTIEALPHFLTLTLDSVSVQGGYDEIHLLVSALWTMKNYGESFHRFLHSTGYLYPSGDWQVEQALVSGGPDLVTVARQMAPETLPVFARQVVKCVYGSRREPYFANLDYHSLAACSVESDYPRATTNLARAKEIVRSGDLHSERDMVRFRCAHDLYGLIETTNKIPHMIELLGPLLQRLLVEEKVRDIHVQWLAVVDLLAARVFLHADRGELVLYQKIEPFLESLVENRFNLDLNLARLWEASRYLGKENDDLLLRLTRLVGRKSLSPLWSGMNPVFPDLEAWLTRAEERLALSLGLGNSRAE